MKNTRCLTAIFIILPLAIFMAGCTPAPDQAATRAAPTAAPSPVPTATLTPTVTPSPTLTLTPTPDWPEMSAEKQDYLNGFEEGYRIVDENGVQAVLVTYGGQEYKVMVEENGVWVRNYDDMAKFVHGKSFDMEAGKVFSFGVEESEDYRGRKVITINKEDYLLYKEAMEKILASLDPESLGSISIEYIRSSIGTTLTGNVELKLQVLRSDGLPQMIGLAYDKDHGVWMVTLATDKGPITLSFVDGKIIDFGENDHYGDMAEEMSHIANGYVGLDEIGIPCLMTSESLNGDPIFTIGDVEAEAKLRALARGLGMSFKELTQIVGSEFTWVDKKQIGVAKTLSELDQPIPAYDIRH